MGDGLSRSERIEDLKFKQRQLLSNRPDLIEVIAADVIVGDQLSWGGELLDVTRVDPDDDAIDIYGTRDGWTFPIEFLPYEVVRIAPRSTV